MSCEKCKDLCVRFAIRQPQELRRAIQIVKQNLDDGTITEVSNSDPMSPVTFADLAKGEQWGDIVGYRFLCSSCGELFLLHAETYHGSGGYWEPEHRESIRESL